uniref:PARP catalytic domain-containing protein n=1 Tax=Populus alba TaxID=43335 RepID=A0A4U5NKR9_POPAL|nr:hypothetical protein D5086_0000268810 [Populus alba]
MGQTSSRGSQVRSEGVREKIYFFLTRQDTKSLEEKKFGVKGLERKTTDESEHFLWKDDIKVPCGRLIPSVHNEYAIYDPKQTSIRFFMDTAEPLNEGRGKGAAKREGPYRSFCP